MGEEHCVERQGYLVVTSSQIRCFVSEAELLSTHDL